jgi:hypothetical protein
MTHRRTYCSIVSPINLQVLPILLIKVEMKLIHTVRILQSWNRQDEATTCLLTYWNHRALRLFFCRGACIAKAPRTEFSRLEPLEVWENVGSLVRCIFWDNSFLVVGYVPGVLSLSPREFLCVGTGIFDRLFVTPDWNESALFNHFWLWH